MMRSASADGVDLRLLVIPLVEPAGVHFLRRLRTESDRRRTCPGVGATGLLRAQHWLCRDLGDGRAPETNLSQSFQDTAAFRWLQDHAARYHFVLSFPEGNKQGVMFEPWHWRYEGNADALRLFEPARRFAGATLDRP